ncbi:SLC13 family permease [Vibrio makurazakiensis]|uniref:SLC13 family permease n=1 Tax=Vibrio makurazakiensis TaxID=2910250 RepID=UPI003D1212DE
MSYEGWFTLALTVLVLFTLIKTSIGPHIVMMAALTILSVTGILTTKEVLSGFSNSGLITVAAMFVVAAGIYHSGGINFIVNRLLGNPKTVRGALLRIFLPVAPLSAFLNNTPVVATMLPAMIAWSNKTNIAPSRLLIPLSYTAILGGTVTQIGTSTNLIVNGQYQSLTGESAFGLFDITIISLPVAILGMLFIYILSPLLLPDTRENKPLSKVREFTLEVCVTKDGALDGKSIKEAGLRSLKGLFLVEIERGDSVLPTVSPDEILQGGDRLVFAGETKAITDLLKIDGIEAPGNLEQPLLLEHKRQERALVEVVVSPFFEALGTSIRDSEFRNKYDAVVLAVARNSERLNSNLGAIKIQAGDTLLLETKPEFASNQMFNREFLLVNVPEHETPNHEKASLSWLFLIVAVTSAATGLTSMLNASLVAAGAMLVFGCLSARQAEKSLDITVILTIGASFALGLALQKSGVASYLAELIVGLSSGNAVILLVLTYVTVSVLTEVITNNAAAVLMLPLIIEVTENASLNPTPYIFAIMMAASASFATPLGYQTNLMVFGPGNYRFSDYLKIGIPMNLLVGMTTITILYLVFPLTL